MRLAPFLAVAVLLAVPVLAAPTHTVVRITAPTENAVLAGYALVTGTASPAGAITGIEVTLNRGPPYAATLGAVSGSTVSWSLEVDTQGYPDGRYLVMAETVTYGFSNSSMVNVTLRNQPRIAVTSPAASTVVNGVVTLSGTATSPYTPLVDLSLAVDHGAYTPATVSGSATSLAWSWTVDTSALGNGPHDFHARVTNAYGKTTYVAHALIVGNPRTWDLSVDSVVGSGSDVLVTLRNEGNTATPVVDVLLEYDDDGTWRRYSVGRTAVGPFTTFTLRVPYAPTSALVGTWTLRATADAGSVVAETDETDNRGTGTVTFFTDLVRAPP